jgi:hypothetical protein
MARILSYPTTSGSDLAELHKGHDTVSEFRDMKRSIALSMGDLNQNAFIEEHMSLFDGPILEIGSRDYGTTPNLRPLFPDAAYLGVDMQAGPGVDQQIDLSADFAEVDLALEGKRFKTIFCLSVLEHCQQPFKMCENISKLLEPGGAVYVSAPFSWEFHGYPSDYWRFTPEGLKVLFPDLEFPVDYERLHTPRPGDIRRPEREQGAIVLSTKRAMENGGLGRALTISFLRVLRAIGIGRWLLDYSKLFPPVMIDMVGIRRS